MSRTDNTDPRWVRAIWWEPQHWRCQYSRISRRRCDLPGAPLVAEYRAVWKATGRWKGGEHCIWVPTWDEMRNSGARGAAAEFIRINFTKPERRRLRDQLARARAEYRATGEVDVIADTDQHRHRGLWT